jgi:dTDP-4-dehydrorhamnose 3,5-epimerase
MTETGTPEVTLSPVGGTACLLIGGASHLTRDGIEQQRYHWASFAAAGILDPFLVETLITSPSGSLRQPRHHPTQPHARLVRVERGRLFVAVAAALAAEDGKRLTGHTVLGEHTPSFLYVPPEYALGWLVLTPSATVAVRSAAFADEDAAEDLPWDDASLDIPWPTPDEAAAVAGGAPW